MTSFWFLFGHNATKALSARQVYSKVRKDYGGIYEAADSREAENVTEDLQYCNLDVEKTANQTRRETPKTMESSRAVQKKETGSSGSSGSCSENEVAETEASPHHPDRSPANVQRHHWKKLTKQVPDQDAIKEPDKRNKLVAAVEIPAAISGEAWSGVMAEFQQRSAEDTPL